MATPSSANASPLVDPRHSEPGALGQPFPLVASSQPPVQSRHLGMNFEAPFTVGRAVPAHTLSPGYEADVVVKVARTAPPAEEEPGPIVAQLKPTNTAGYTVYSVPGGYLFRFPRACDFRVDADGRNVVCLPAPTCPDGLLPILLAGTIAAWLLTLRGHAVLHASAVRWGGATMLIAGRSGLGKSTVAALCCAAGAQLVADDVAALQGEREGVACTGLGSELRLRRPAFGIADLFSPPLVGSLTTDGRLAIRPSSAEQETNLISAVLFPRPRRDSSEVVTRSVDAGQALLLLLANARIAAMVQPTLQKTYFETVSALVSAVPVMEAWVPWGPPFAVEAAREVLAQAVSAAENAGRSHVG